MIHENGEFFQIYNDFLIIQANLEAHDKEETKLKFVRKTRIDHEINWGSLPMKDVEPSNKE
jgi:hypothetical protein